MKTFFSLSALRRSVLALLIVPVLLAACDDDTAIVGTGIMPGNDLVNSSQQTFRITSRTVKTDSVLANTNDSYLGCFIDPETRAKTTCNFLAQFNVLEDTKLPARERLINDSEGRIIVDSCDVRIYIDNYYGDSLTTMKMAVHELDIDKPVSENGHYYTTLNADDFLTEGKGFSTTLSYSVKDLSRPDSVTDGNTYYRCIIVRMPAEYGRRMMEKYYENPDNYKNSYNFIHNVCPGFLFKVTGGVGSMIYAKTTTLNVYFPYHTFNEEGRDTIMGGMQRMAATEEVIQQTTVENEIPASMLNPDNDYTYIKSPAGLFTEITLPVADIVAGEHYTDSINAVSLTLPRHNNEVQNAFNLASPANILLLPKSEAYTFFEKNKLVDNVTSYLTTFNTDYNAYNFSNLSKLVTWMKQQRDNGAGVVYTDTEAQRNAKYAVWEAQNPDWNKVWLIPVNAHYSTSTNIYGGTTKVLLSIKNALSMNSVRLKGGANSDLSIDVVYTKFND